VTDKYQNKYRIASARHPRWDYGWNAAYFVTICTKNRVFYFGDVVDGKTQLSDIGLLAHRFWNEIPNHFSYVQLGAWVIMPNHMHGIIIINKPDDGRNVGNGQSGDGRDVETPKLGVSTQTAAASQKWKPRTLGVMINQYKRAVTIHARKNDLVFTWQPRFHDHIIRDENEYQRIENYIIHNPLNWNNDKFYE